MNINNLQKFKRVKILWFTNTPSLYKKTPSNYNGCGWIASLEQIIAGEKNIELAVSFFHTDECFKSKQGNTTYYPIPLYNTKSKKLKHNLFYNKYDEKEITYFLKVIEDYQPDVIHVFGSESSFGLITTRTSIPVVIHIQGLLNPCQNAYFAPGSNKLNLITQHFFKPGKLFDLLRVFSFFNYNVKREAEILKNSKYFMGRTDWDRDVTSLYAPGAKYFYCSEVLRDIFYTSSPWQLENRDKIILVSVISKTTYKGFDLILKAARLLKELTSQNVEWNVFGVKEYKEWGDSLKINFTDVGVILKGIADSETLVKNIQAADFFVHPSYIDNSPNSVCEAQMLGIPVISTNVGGISSLIDNTKSGYLIPSNDPYALAARIIELKNNPEKATETGKNGRKSAFARHRKETIKNDLLNIYEELNNANASHKSINFNKNV